MSWHSSSFDLQSYILKGRNVRTTAPTPEEARKILERKLSSVPKKKND